MTVERVEIKGEPSMEIFANRNLETAGCEGKMVRINLKDLM